MKEEQYKDFNFDELDKEIGLGELLKQKENWLVRFAKRAAYLVLLIVIGIMVFFASFSIGKILFMADSKNNYDQTVFTNGLTQDETEIINADQTPVPDATESVTENVTKEITIEPVKEEPKPVPATAPKIVAKEAPKATVTPAPAPKVVAKELPKPTPAPTPAPAPKVVVKELPKVTPTPVQPVTVTPVATGYSLIAGTFSQKTNAENLVKQLSAMNFAPTVTEANRNGSIYYRVIAGKYQTADAAKEKQTLLKSKGIESIFIPAGN